MEDGVFPITSVSLVQGRQKLVRIFSHYYFDGCLLTHVKSVVFIEFLEDKCSSWNKCQNIMSFMVVSVENPGTEVPQWLSWTWFIQTTWRHADSKVLALHSAPCVLYEHTFNFHCCVFRISKNYPIAFDSILLAGNKSVHQQMLPMYLRYIWCRHREVINMLLCNIYIVICGIRWK